MQLTKEDSIGIGVTVGIHLLILLALFFALVKITPPDPPLPEGMEIDFGMSVEGSGTDNMAIPTGPVVSSNPTTLQTPVKATPQNNPQEMMTSETGEEMAMPKPNRKPITEDRNRSSTRAP